MNQLLFLLISIIILLPSHSKKIRWVFNSRLQKQVSKHLLYKMLLSEFLNNLGVEDGFLTMTQTLDAIKDYKSF